MSPSLRELLSGIIDYAGLFPPANLPLDEAIRNYARYRTEPESWMLARFVCPAKRLAELNTHRSKLPEALNLSVLGSDVASIDVECSPGSALFNDSCALRLYRGPERQVHVDAVELRLSGNFFHPSDKRAVIRAAIRLANDQALAQGSSEAVSSTLTKEQLLAEVLRATVDLFEKGLEEQNLPLVSFYFEVDDPSEWRGAVKTLTSILRAEPLRRHGLKVRCGGLKPDAFPPPEQVAFAITACRDAGLPLKFTAGLHHPIRHFDAGVQTKMHGFLNVFGAGVLAHARNLNQDQVERIIGDEDARNFVFDDSGFRWKDWHASIEEIRAARQQLVSSFGSCSFDEPRDDLRGLGLLS